MAFIDFDINQIVSDYHSYEWPFPHVVVDNFLPACFLNKVLDEWPTLDERAGWSYFSNDQEERWAWNKGAPMGLVTEAICDEMNSPERLLEWEAAFGILNLIADPDLVGGGPHEILPGGKLGVHADFNRHPVSGLDRRLNAFLYLNHDWQDQWGGHLDLWDERCINRIRHAPIFGRLVIFPTTTISFHGHPHPLECPPGVTRKSLAFYYYTDGRDDGFREPHSTVFVS